MDVFTAMADDEAEGIPLELLQAIAGLLRSIRTAETPKEAEAIARKLRIHKSVRYNLDPERAASAHNVIRSARAKEILAKIVVREMMKPTGSDMAPDDVKNAVRGVKKRHRQEPPDFCLRFRMTHQE